MIREFGQKDIDKIREEWLLLEKEAAQRCRYPREMDIVKKAFEYANRIHMNVCRPSGDPYVLHPIRVARIVITDVGLGYKSIVTSLLHDVFEDSDTTVEDIRNEFGDKIATLVDGMKQIQLVLSNEQVQYEQLKKVLLYLGDDARVVLIKLADRLQNCRRFEHLPQAKQKKILEEIEFLFIPLAHRLGLYNVKSEMENLWMRYRVPEEYSKISGLLESRNEVMEQEMDDFIYAITSALKGSGIDFKIKKRIKSTYSIWKKMKTKGVTLEEIFDLCAIRIIFDCPHGSHIEERSIAYHIFAVITGMFTYLPNRTRDWIYEPRTNGYEALHCTVMNQAGKWIEVQIRSQRMDDIAEKGLAAHWAYKRDGYTTENDSQIDKWMSKVRDVLNCNDNESLDTLEFIDKETVNL